MTGPVNGMNRQRSGSSVVTWARIGEGLWRKSRGAGSGEEGAIKHR